MKTYMMLQRFSGPDGVWAVKATALTALEMMMIISTERCLPDTTGIPRDEKIIQVSRRSNGDGAKRVYYRFIADQDTDFGDIAAEEETT